MTKSINDLLNNQTKAQKVVNYSSNEAANIVSLVNLGYCEPFDFKCAGDRTCDAWITGGPLTDEVK